MTRSTMEQAKRPLWRLEDFLRFAAENNTHIENNGKDVQVVIFGEAHDRDDHIRVFCELVRRTDPGIILVEHIVQGSYYDPYRDTFYFRDPNTGELEDVSRNEMSEREETYRPIFDLAHEKKILLIGADLPFLQILDRLDPEKREALTVLYLLVGLKKSPYDAERVVGSMPETMKIRDESFVEEILTRAQEHSGPIIFLAGSTHAQNIHNRKLLENKNLPGWVMIDMTKPAPPDLKETYR